MNNQIRHYQNLIRKSMRDSKKNSIKFKSILLYDADPNCKHNIVEKISGIKCTKCDGWSSY